MSCQERDYWRTQYDNNKNNYSKTPWIILLLIMFSISAYSINKNGLTPPSNTIQRNTNIQTSLDFNTGTYFKNFRSAYEKIDNIINELINNISENKNNTDLDKMIKRVNSIKEDINQLNAQSVSKEYTELKAAQISNIDETIEKIESYLLSEQDDNVIINIKNQYSEYHNKNFIEMKKLFDKNAVKYNETTDGDGKPELIFYYKSR